MRIVILCDLCKQPLVLPKDARGNYRREGRCHASVYFQDTDRIPGKGFRFKGEETRATICALCWAEKARPALEFVGVKFETEHDDGVEEQDYILAPEPYPREFKLGEHDLYTIVSCLLSRQRNLREGCYDESQQRWIDEVIKKLGGIPPKLAAWLAECDAARRERQRVQGQE
jgi:hypothetical protein